MRRNKWLIVCLLLLQGLALAISPDARARGLAERGVTLSATAQCSPQSQNDDGGPARERHSHSQCCLSCSSDFLDDFHRLVSTLAELLVFPELKTALGSLGRPRDDRDGRPAGWTSSWSSRAPPSFS